MIASDYISERIVINLIKEGNSMLNCKNNKKICPIIYDKKISPNILRLLMESINSEYEAILNSLDLYCYIFYPELCRESKEKILSKLNSQFSYDLEELETIQSEIFGQKDLNC